MTLYELFLFLHIVSAIIWLGAATTYVMLELRTDLSGDIELETSHNDDAGWLAPRLFIPAAMGTLIFGILAAIEGNWSFDSLWIIVGLTGFALSFLIGVGYFEPEIKKLADEIEEKGATGPDVRRRVANLKMVGRIELVILFIVVASMVIKPTGDDGGVLIILATVLAVVCVAALAWRARMSTAVQS
ncbi:MAG TPA: DUF2269 family protein [Solirubrobacterales bacterium]|nr:DUF2269 family protein [Solirubrobacterales bacterium]